jgi:hypothetical protein
MAENQPVERTDEDSQEEVVELEDSENGSGQAPGEYEEELARFLQERIKPNLSRSTIPLVARSIAKEIAGRQRLGAPGAGPAHTGDGRPAPDFEADRCAAGACRFPSLAATDDRLLLESARMSRLAAGLRCRDAVDAAATRSARLAGRALRAP